MPACPCCGSLLLDEHISFEDEPSWLLVCVFCGTAVLVDDGGDESE